MLALPPLFLKGEGKIKTQKSTPRGFLSEPAGVLVFMEGAKSIKPNYTTPCAIIASATLRKPATFAPTMRSPGRPHSTDAS